MMLRQMDEPENATLSVYTAPTQRAAISEPEIEDYLDHFSAPLVGKVSFEERTKMRADLRFQIEQIVIAYQELGSTRAEAVAETLQQFRQTQPIQTPVLAQSQVHQESAMPQAPKKYGSFALKCFAISSFAALLGLFADLASESNGLTFLIVGVSSTALAGLLAGYRTPDRILRATFKAHLKLIIPFILGELLIRSFRLHHPHHFWQVVPGFWLIGSSVIGGFGALIGKFIKKTNLLDKLDPPAQIPEAEKRF